MKAIYLWIPDLPELLDVSQLEQAVYTTMRENMTYGAVGNDVDVMIAPSALKRFWKAVKADFERRFGTIFRLPEVPEILAIPHLYHYCSIFMPHSNSLVHVILNPAMEKDRGILAVICWLAL